MQTPETYRQTGEEEDNTCYRVEKGEANSNIEQSIHECARNTYKNLEKCKPPVLAATGATREVKKLLKTDFNSLTKAQDGTGISELCHRLISIVSFHNT